MQEDAAPPAGMFSKPSHEFTQSIQRRPATLEEMNALFVLHREAFKGHVERLWGQWEEEWQRENFDRQCVTSDCEVVVQEESVLGYVQSLRGTTRIFIRNIALWPEFRSQGVGTRILLEFQEIARTLRVDLALRVFPTNLAAARFYERLGFREMDRSATAIELVWRAD